ncbi:cyclic GMP-AMP synthase-like receptor 2 [Clytia hemisphaerica]
MSPEPLEQCLNNLFVHIPTNLDKATNKAKRYLRITKETLESKPKLNIETELFLAGSVAEGLSIPISLAWIDSASNQTIIENHALVSDLDFMISPKTDFVSFNRESTEEYHATLLTYDGEWNWPSNITEDNPGVRVTQDTTPPFFNITSNNEELKGYTIKKMIKETIRSLTFDSFPDYVEESCCQLFCMCCLQRYVNFARIDIKGPSIKYKLGSEKDKHDRFHCDLTYSLKCDEWPDISDWGQRGNAKWPADGEIDAIKGNGCHFVPREQGMRTGSTWRISFSKAEVTLMKHVPTSIRKCFIGFRTICKNHVFPVSANKLKSIHLKYILFFTLEQHGVDGFENLDRCIDSLLQSLEESFDTKKCPIFWMSAVNMYENFKLSELQWDTLLKKVRDIRERPNRYIEGIEPIRVVPNDEQITSTSE